MPSHDGYKCRDSLEQDSFLKIIDEYRDYPSIKFTSAKNNSQIIKFSQRSQDLGPKKASEKDGIETNLLRKNAEFFAKYTCNDINDSICFSEFPNELKKLYIMPTHKKAKAI